MSTRKKLVVCGVLGLAAVALVMPWNTLAASDGGHRCRFEGAWTFRNGGFWLVETITSLDPANNRVALAAEWLAGDPTFGGLYADVARVSTMRGEAVRTGLRTFDYRAVGYGLAPESIPAEGRVRYIWVTFGTKTFADDCNSYTVFDGHEIYDAAADGDGNGFPDPGAVPVLTFGGGPSPPIVRLPEP